MNHQEGRGHLVDETLAVQAEEAVLHAPFGAHAHHHELVSAPCLRQDRVLGRGVRHLKSTKEEKGAEGSDKRG